MPWLQKACCCLELATGTAIIGWLGALASVVDIIAGIISLSSPNSSPHDGTGKTIFTIIICLVSLLISILLIRGAMTRNRRFLPPYLIAVIIDTIILNYLYLYVSFATGDLSYIMPLIISDLIIGYLWSIVYSLYQELEENPRGPTVLNVV